MNKIDLVSEQRLEETKKVLKDINSSAEVIETQNSLVDLKKILGVSSFSVEKTLEHDPSFLDENKSKIHDLTESGSVGIECEGELDFNLVNEFMMNLLQENSANMYRSKGVFCFQGQGDTKFVFQGVHEQINFGRRDSVEGRRKEVESNGVYWEKFESRGVGERLPKVFGVSNERRRFGEKSVLMYKEDYHYYSLRPQRDKRRRDGTTRLKRNRKPLPSLFDSE